VRFAFRSSRASVGCGGETDPPQAHIRRLAENLADEGWIVLVRGEASATAVQLDGLATERESEIAVRGRCPKKTIKLEQLVRLTADGGAVTEPACSSEFRRRWSILLTSKKLMSSQRYEK
jgi:hypothetical protein